MAWNAYEAAHEQSSSSYNTQNDSCSSSAFQTISSSQLGCFMCYMEWSMYEHILMHVSILGMQCEREEGKEEKRGDMHYQVHKCHTDPWSFVTKFRNETFASEVYGEEKKFYEQRALFHSNYFVVSLAFF